MRSRARGEPLALPPSRSPYDACVHAPQADGPRCKGRAGPKRPSRPLLRSPLLAPLRAPRAGPSAPLRCSPTLLGGGLQVSCRGRRRRPAACSARKASLRPRHAPCVPAPAAGPRLRGRARFARGAAAAAAPHSPPPTAVPAAGPARGGPKRPPQSGPECGPLCPRRLPPRPLGPGGPPGPLRSGRRRPPGGEFYGGPRRPPELRRAGGGWGVRVFGWGPPISIRCPRTGRFAAPPGTALRAENAV